MIDFEIWWNSADADAFRAEHEEFDGEHFRPVWDAAVRASLAAPQPPQPAQPAQPVQADARDVACDHSWTWANGKCADCGEQTAAHELTDDEILEEYSKHVVVTYCGGVNVLSAMQPEGFIKGVRALLAAHPGQPEPKEPSSPDDIQGWSVTVEVNGVGILTISDNCVSGIDNIADFDGIVRNCAQHLIGFIGQPEPRAEVTDTARLDWLRDECCDLRSVSVPTGGDDYDVNWIVIQHHMAAPHEREIGRGFSDDPRDAIDAARTGASS